MTMGLQRSGASFEAFAFAKAHQDEVKLRIAIPNILRPEVLGGAEPRRTHKALATRP
jgi:hypothetical protein